MLDLIIIISLLFSCLLGFIIMVNSKNSKSNYKDTKSIKNSDNNVDKEQALRPQLSPEAKRITGGVPSFG
jgi:hypothetical protein